MYVPIVPNEQRVTAFNKLNISVSPVLQGLNETLLRNLLGHTESRTSQLMLY